MGQPNYKPLTLLSCARLAAPHTWPGPSVMSSVFGGVYSIWAGYSFSWPVWVLLLLCATMAQSSVNTLNDWADFRAGTDTVDNSDDPTDAVLVYENPNPRSVFILAMVYLVVAIASGLFCCVWAGTALPIIIAVLGAAAIVGYTLLKLPISYLPIGELVSGVVMSLIVLADVIIFAAAGTDGGPFSLSIMSSTEWLHIIEMLPPFIIGIGLTMATQNCCDIERDIPVGRHTLAVVMGRSRFVWLYRILIVLWIAMVLHLSFWFFRPGFWAAVVVLVLGIGSIRFSLTTPLVHEVRGPSMASIGKCELFIFGALTMAAIVSIISEVVPLL